MRLLELLPTDYQNALFKCKLAIQIREQANPDTILGKRIIQAYDSHKVTDTKILNYVRDMAKDNPEKMKELFSKQVIEDILNLE